MLTIFFDYTSSIPLYEQLYNFIRKAIEDEELIANEKLPSKRKLAQHLKISVITIENAYNQLIAEGYIKSIPKSGYYVLPYIRLKTLDNQKNKKAIRKIAKPKYKVDFRTNQVDSNSFPYERLAKIEKDVMLDRYPKYINDSDYMGVFSLRAKIAEILFEYRGIETSPESIVIGSGSEHLISLLILLLGRNKIFGVEEPGYLKNYQLYLDYGAKAKTIKLDEYGVNTKDLSNIDIIHVTPSHQFPTGIVIPISRRMELLNWSSLKTNKYIIEDDYDSEFRFSGMPIPAMKSLDTFDKVIYMNSFSKSLSPSFRVSFMVLPDKLLEEYHNSYSYFTCSVPVITQLVLEKFIEDKEYEKHLNRMKNLYKNKRDYLINKLKNSRINEYIKILGEESGLHFLLKVNTDKKIEDFIESAKLEGVRVYGINEYYLETDTNISEKTIVLGYSHLSEDDFDLAVNLLEKAWKKLF